MEKKIYIYKNRKKKSHNACVLAEHATVNSVDFFFILELSNFFFLCALSMREKEVFGCAQREKKHHCSVAPDDDLDPPDLMTYVLCLFLFVFLHTGNTGWSQRLMVLTDEEPGIQFSQLISTPTSSPLLRKEPKGGSHW